MVTGDGDPLGLGGGASVLQSLVDAHLLLSGLCSQRRADPQASHFLGDGPTAERFVFLVKLTLSATRQCSTSY